MRSLIHSGVVMGVLCSRVVSAACAISDLEPTEAVPTMTFSQRFEFVATHDCERLRYRVPGEALSKIPTLTAGAGTSHRTYEVLLTEREWNSLIDESETTFTWSIVGMTSAGTTTRVTMTNALDIDQPTLDLSLADAKLAGEKTGEQAGYDVSEAGDVDGDGHDDLALIACADDEGGDAAGAAYLVLGPVTGTRNLSRADAKLVGERGADYVSDVSSAGDVDDDGYDDVLIGAWGNDEGGEYAGAAYVVRGPVTGTLSLSLADIKLVGEEAYDGAGESVAGGGDIDGNGRDDLLVGTYYYSGAELRTETAYVVLGPVTASLDLSHADAKLVGEDASYLQTNVADARDVDADGRDDVMVAATSGAYLVLGPVTGVRDLSLADAKFVGASMTGAGDVDGDGHDDLLGGTIADNEGGSSAGAAYLVLGPVTGTFDLSFADAKLVGEDRDDNAGWSVSGAGDADGDGKDDVLVGARLEDEGGFYAGAAYLVLGPITGTLDLAWADAKLVGEQANNYAGYSVSGAGDVDADGLDDVLVGAPLNHDDAGAAYVVYGGGLF